MEQFPRMGSDHREETPPLDKKQMMECLWDMESNGSADYELADEYRKQVDIYEEQFGSYERVVSGK